MTEIEHHESDVDNDDNHNHNHYRPSAGARPRGPQIKYSFWSAWQPTHTLCKIIHRWRSFPPTPKYRVAPTLDRTRNLSSGAAATLELYSPFSRTVQFPPLRKTKYMFLFSFPTNVFHIEQRGLATHDNLTTFMIFGRVRFTPLPAARLYVSTGPRHPFWTSYQPRRHREAIPGSKDLLL